MKKTLKKSSDGEKGWFFVDHDPRKEVTGEFVALDAERTGRLYFPLANEGGMRSWVSPSLQGSPAGSHNEYLGLPLTAEDMPNSLVHRGFWMVEEGREPFALSCISPGGINRFASRTNSGPESIVHAGPGWFTLLKEDASRRFSVRATLWCPADLDDRVELMTVEVKNRSKRKLRFNAYAALPLYARSADAVRDHRHVTALLNRVRIHKYGVTAHPTMSFDERGHQVNRTEYTVMAFGPRGTAPEGIWPTQESFLGEGGNFAAPTAVWRGELKPRMPVARMQGAEGLGGFRFKAVTLAPGRSARFTFLSGISVDSAAPRKWAAWISRKDAAERSLAHTKKSWQDRLNRLQFKTADVSLDNWLVWVNAQPVLRRLYGNSYLPQFDYGRGGKGWRDLWQDCLALLLSDPKRVRPMLMHNFGGVRIDGSNATIIGTDGSFIADRNNIPRTWMDHGVWPLYTTFLYLDQTGDVDFLFKKREYFRDPRIRRCRVRDAKWDEAYGHALRARNGEIYKGTILEHILAQNLTAFFNVGEHNLCRLEGADWNDGLDMASDRGESVAFSGFYAWNLKRLADLLAVLETRGIRQISLARELLPLMDRLPGQRRVNYASARARSAHLEKYFDVVSRDVSGKVVAVSARDLIRDLRAKAGDLSRRISTQEWVRGEKGYTFFNGYYDNNGKRVEGRHGGKVRMMLTSQVFPLMSGIAADEQADSIIRSVQRYLRDPVTGGIRLNTDFGDIQPALGRAFSFAYGEKENGAVFSHMAVMYAFALYRRRYAREGRRVWMSLYRAAMNQDVSKILPGLPEYFNAAGRGLYCYLTGSASWLVYLLLTEVYGIRGELGDLVLDPQLTREDFNADGECAVTLHFADRPITVVYRNRKQLNVDKYRVQNILRGSKPVAFTQRPNGGVLIRRSLIRRFSRDKETRLLIELGSGEK